MTLGPMRAVSTLKRYLDPAGSTHRSVESPPEQVGTARSE